MVVLLTHHRGCCPGLTPPSPEWPPHPPGSRYPPQALQLRSLAAALRKPDDVTGVLQALQRLELLVRAAPDELASMSAELVRSLLHCRVPEWAEAEPGRWGGQCEGGKGRDSMMLPWVQGEGGSVMLWWVQGEGGSVRGAV